MAKKIEAPQHPPAEQGEELHEVFKVPLEGFTLIGRASKDNLKLFLDIESSVQPRPPDLRLPKSEEIISAVKTAGIPEITNPEVLIDMLKELNTGQASRKRRIVRGTPPIPGRDGKMVFLAKRMGTPREVKVDEHGKADFSHMHLFDNISQGQIVARIYPPHRGTAGIDIFGKDIPAPEGKPVQLKPDPTLEEGQEEGHSEYRVLRATQSGYLMEESGKFKIQHDLVISGDLDYHFGTLDFIGKIVITGDVMPGFNINARDGIEIKGSVRGGSLVSTHGTIKVDGFVYGGENSRVIAGKEFIANIVQEVNAEIRGDITVIKEARDSMLRTEATFKIEKGHLYGGKTLVVCGAECGILGSDVETPTIIEIVGDMEATVAYSQLKVRISNHEKAIELLRLHLGPMAENRKRVEYLKPDHKVKITALLTKLDKLVKSLKILIKRRSDLVAGARTNIIKRVNVHAKMFPGARVVVKDKFFKPLQPLPGPISIDFDAATGQFITGPLKGLECTYDEAGTRDEATPGVPNEETK